MVAVLDILGVEKYGDPPALEGGTNRTSYRGAGGPGVGEKNLSQNANPWTCQGC
jgi:hypothetical protein